MILCLISDRFVIKILVGVELAPVDSRAYASRPHQVLKRSRARWIAFGPSQEDEKPSSEDFKKMKTCV